MFALLSHGTREEFKSSRGRRSSGSSSPKASLGKEGEKGSCVVERRNFSSACLSWGTGNLSREGFGVVFEAGRSLMSPLVAPEGLFWKKWVVKSCSSKGERKVSQGGPLKCAHDPEVFGEWVVAFDCGRRQLLQSFTHFVLNRERNFSENHKGPVL